MAKILDTTPSWLKKENASVFDSFPKKAARKVAELLGLDTAEGQIESAVMPAPLVSIFKNKAARVAGTEAFKKAARSFEHPELKEALRHFGLDYPRVAAHMHPEEVAAGGKWSGALLMPEGKVTKPMSAGFNIDEAAHKFPSEAKNTVYHEGTHAAQALGNKDFDRLYGDASELVGYKDNPFEVQARKAGTRSVMGNSGQPAGNAITDLTGLAKQEHVDFNNLPYSYSVDRTRKSAANSIDHVMERRTGIPRTKPDLGPSGDELTKFLNDYESKNSKFKKKVK